MSVYAGYETIGDLPQKRRRNALCGIAVVGVILVLASASTIIYLWLTSSTKTPPTVLPQITQVAKKGVSIGPDEFVIYSADGCKVTLLSFDNRTSNLAILASSPDLGCHAFGAVDSLGVSLSQLEVVVSIGSALLHLTTSVSSWTPVVTPIDTPVGDVMGRVANAVNVDGHEIYFYVLTSNGTNSAVGAVNLSSGFPETVDSIGLVPPSQVNGASDVAWEPTARLVYVAFGEGLAVYSFNASEFEFLTVISTSSSGSDGIWLLSPLLFFAAGSVDGSRVLILDLQNETEIGSLDVPPQYGWAGGVAVRPENKNTAMVAIDVGVLGIDISNLSNPVLQWVCRLGDRAKNYFGWNLDVTSESLLLSDVAGGLQILDLRARVPRTVAHFGAGALATCVYENL